MEKQYFLVTYRAKYWSSTPHGYIQEFLFAHNEKEALDKAIEVIPRKYRCCTIMDAQIENLDTFKACVIKGSRNVFDFMNSNIGVDSRRVKKYNFKVIKGEFIREVDYRI